jgi:hypothetical protein
MAALRTLRRLLVKPPRRLASWLLLLLLLLRSPQVGSSSCRLQTPAESLPRLQQAPAQRPQVAALLHAAPPASHLLPAALLLRAALPQAPALPLLLLLGAARRLQLPQQLQPEVRRQNL